MNDRVGHPGMAITADIYGHLKLGPKAEVANFVGKLLSIGTASASRV